MAYENKSLFVPNYSTPAHENASLSNASRQMQSVSSLGSWHFAMAGNWENSVQGNRTVDNIKNHSKNLDLIIGLGNYWAADNDNNTALSEWWNHSLDLLGIKFNAILGNLDTGKISLYKKLFRINNLTYSFEHKGIHFLAINTWNSNDDQDVFIKSDLDKAQSDGTIKWIIILLHKPMYTAIGPHEPDILSIKKFHPLFDNYSKVAMVVQAYNTNYQRSYPLFYNPANPYYPIVTDFSRHQYNQGCGQIYTIVGTAGLPTTGFGNKPYYIYSGDVMHGFLDIEVKDEGNTLYGKFYHNDHDTYDDFFTITSNNNIHGMVEKCDNKIFTQKSTYPFLYKLVTYLYGVDNKTGDVAVFATIENNTEGSVVNASQYLIDPYSEEIAQINIELPHLKVQLGDQLKLCAMVVSKTSLVCYEAKVISQEQTVHLLLNDLPEQ